MTLTVNIKDKNGNILRTLQFPDGTNQNVIRKTVQATKGSTLGGIAEAASTIGRGIAGEVAGGLAGIATIFGDDPAGNVRATRDFIAGDGPNTIAGEQALQSFGDFIEPAVEVGNLISSGLVGLASLPTGGVDAAVENIKSVNKRGLGETLGDLGADVNPALGALGKTTPAALLSAPVVAPLARGLRTPKDVAPPGGVKPKPLVKPTTSFDASFEVGTAPELATYKTIVSDLQKGKSKRAAVAVKPIEEIRLAAEELKIDLNPSHYSSNRAFIDVEQSLKSQPGTKLAGVEEAAIAKLGQVADDLIKETIKKDNVSISLFDDEVRTSFTTTIKNLEKKSDKFYNAIDEAIPGATIIIPTASKVFIDGVLKSFGGNVGALTAIEKRLLDTLTVVEKGKRVEKNVTYAELDRLRKDIGDGYNKTGPFKDESVANLDQVYKALSIDQQAVTTGFGVGAEYAAARKLVQSRKDLELRALELFGSNIRGSLVPKITGAANKLTKGDVSGLRNMLKAVPKKHRAEAAAMVLDAIFSAGSRIPGTLGPGFVKAFKGLNDNPSAKAMLFAELPPEVLVTFEKIGKVATGIFRSKALENTSRTARDLIAAMDDGGMFAKIYQNTGQIVAAEGLTSSFGATGLGTTFVVLKAFWKGRTTATEAADSLLTSPRFSKAIEMAANGNIQGSNALMRGTAAFQNWLRTLSPNDAAQVAAVGLIPWLLEDVPTSPPGESRQNITTNF